MPFRAEGIATVLQIEDYGSERNPGYHNPGDTVAQINFAYFAGQVKASTAAAAHLAGLEYRALCPLVSGGGR